MAGRHINDQQVRLYMRLRADHTQVTSAAKAGLSVSTGRRAESDPRPPSSKRQRRAYRTRSDPLAGLWDEEVVPMLQAAPGLRPISLFDELARRHPDRIGPSFRRTLERRVAEWKALHGAGREVMFRQVQQPGRMGLSDFTEANDRNCSPPSCSHPAGMTACPARAACRAARAAKLSPPSTISTCSKPEQASAK